MNPFDYFKTVVTEKYADFSGRARRSEYWYYALFNIIFAIVAAAIDGLLGLGFVYLIYSLAMFIPGLAVSVRRLHDTNRSGWFLLIAFIPLIGAIVLLVWFVSEGDRNTNDYGPDPKDPNAGVDDITDHLVTDPKDLV